MTFIKGHKHSEETKKVMSDKKKEYYKIHKGFWSGKTFSKETKQKMSLIRKGVKFSEEHKKNLSENSKWLNEKPLTEETREKLSKAFKGRHHTEKTKQEYSKTRKGSKNSNYGKHWSDEVKDRISKSCVKSMLNRSGTFVNTDIERKVKAQLSRNNIGFIQQWPVDDKFICDFFVPDLNLIIECDGQYWHNRPRTIIRDIEKDEYSKGRGYNVLRLSDAEIYQDSFNVLDSLVGY